MFIGGKMVKCTVCNNEVDENAEFCPNCGTKVEEMATTNEVVEQTVSNQNTKFCPNCGKQIDINAVICPKCGVQIERTAEEKSPVLALILSAFFPGIGQFYNGQPKKGIILIIAAIVSLCLMIILIGGILYLIVWIYALYDAYTTAEAINRGETGEDKLF